MPQVHCHTRRVGKAGGDRRTFRTHTQGTDKQNIQPQICDRTDDGGNQHPCGITVYAHKKQQMHIHHQRNHKAEQHAGIFRRRPCQRPARPQQLHDRTGEQKTSQRQYHTAANRMGHGYGEKPHRFRFISLAKIL